MYYFAECKPDWVVIGIQDLEIKLKASQLKASVMNKSKTCLLSFLVNSGLQYAKDEQRYWRVVEDDMTEEHVSWKIDGETSTRVPNDKCMVW